MTKPKSSKGQENCNENKLKEVLKKKIPISTVFSPFLIQKETLLYSFVLYHIRGRNEC